MATSSEIVNNSTYYGIPTIGDLRNWNSSAFKDSTDGAVESGRLDVGDFTRTIFYVSNVTGTDYTTNFYPLGYDTYYVHSQIEFSNAGTCVIDISCACYETHNDSNLGYFDLDNNGFLFYLSTSSEPYESFPYDAVWLYPRYTTYSNTPIYSKYQYSTNVEPGKYYVHIYSNYNVAGLKDWTGNYNIYAGTQISSVLDIDYEYQVKQEPVKYDSTKCPTRAEIINDNNFYVLSNRHNTNDTALIPGDYLAQRYQGIKLNISGWVRTKTDIYTGMDGIYGTYNTTGLVSIGATANSYNAGTQFLTCTNYPIYIDTDLQSTSSSTSSNIDVLGNVLQISVGVNLPRIYVKSSDVGVTFNNDDDKLSREVVIPIQITKEDSNGELGEPVVKYLSITQNASRINTNSNYDSEFAGISGSCSTAIPVSTKDDTSNIISISLLPPSKVDWSVVSSGSSSSGSSSSAVGVFEE